MTTQETIQTVTTSEFIEAIHGSNAEIYFNVGGKTWKNKPQTYNDLESKLKWLIPDPPVLEFVCWLVCLNMASIRTSTLRNWLKTQSSTRTSIRTTPNQHTNEHTQLYTTINLLYFTILHIRVLLQAMPALKNLSLWKSFYVRGNK